MSFVSSRAGDAALIVREQATDEDVTYTPLGSTSSPGAPVTNFSAIWDPLERKAETHSDIRMERRRGVLQTLEADTPDPDTRDVWTIGATNYAVETVHVAEWIVEWELVELVPHRHGGAESSIER